MKVSVIVPVYNESGTIEELLARVLASPVDKEVVCVDDGSTDGTRAILEKITDPRVRVVLHVRNRGKGASIRTGLAAASGEIVLIQDADLEYDPANYPALIEPIEKGRAQVVYGNRFHPGNAVGYTPYKIAARMLTWLTNLLFGAHISDEATCYKVFRADVIRAIPLRCERFEFCPEVTAKVLRRGHAIVEVPIRYTPRTEAEGKKIRWWDGIEAFYTLIYFRFFD